MNGEGFYMGKAVGGATVFKQLAQKNQEQVFKISCKAKQYYRCSILPVFDKVKLPSERRLDTDMASSTYGYVRVSTQEQNEARQMDALRKLCIPEKISSWISSPAKILTARSTRNL